MISWFKFIIHRITGMAAAGRALPFLLLFSTLFSPTIDGQVNNDRPVERDPAANDFSCTSSQK